MPFTQRSAVELGLPVGGAFYSRIEIEDTSLETQSLVEQQQQGWQSILNNCKKYVKAR